MSRRVVIALAAALLVAGCTRAPRAAPTASGIRWDLEMSPYRPSALQGATLRLRVYDSAGRSLAIQGFRATATMPEMTHRGESIAFREMEPGLYEALHTFSMDGRWEIRVRGRSKGKAVEGRFLVDVGR